ncbi:FAD binding domain-containing protein [Irpex rosettiformis]|uniref:FAD binding domain-containing protein n=1 Tax=Irpex rosettiformis TaxID=378272 RepID=A0ACB8TPR1_9APHY|nr:FAD binding domain-containing protein [Irpex rosettiformis]
MSFTAANAARVDVLIVGAGPAGLMAANALTRAGVNIRIVDLRPTSVSYGQADGIMPRTMELFNSYGLADGFFKRANQINMVAFYNTREGGGIHRTAKGPVINAPTARYPFITSLNQGAIESMFLDSLGGHGIIIDRPTRPTSLTLSKDEKELQDPNSYPVTAILEHLQTENKEAYNETVHAKFVIGADGAHSWVRGALDIEMEGEQTDHVWGAIDFTTTSEATFPDWRNICTINAANTTMMLIPREQDKLRLYIELGLENGLIDTATGRVAPQNIDSKRLLEIAEEGLKPYALPPANIEWWTCYVVGQRVASRFSIQQRAFIVGDACHTHSPKGGQGMNVSMNDSHNLAWKLAYVVRGWAGLDLLKTYEFERRKFAQELISFDKWYEAGFSTKARSELFDDKEKKAFLAFSGLTSGVGVQYDPSIIVTATKQDSPVKLALGQRIPPKIVLRAVDSTPIEIQDMCPSDTRFKIAVFTGDITKPSQLDLLRTFAKEIFREGSPLEKLGSDAFDIFSVIKGEKDTVNYLDVPVVLRSHFYKVLLDAIDVTGTKGGKVYEDYGVPPEGGVVVVRPDGYVASITGLDEPVELENYFAKFLTI